MGKLNARARPKSAIFRHLTRFQRKGHEKHFGKKTSYSLNTIIASRSVSVPFEVIPCASNPSESLTLSDHLSPKIDSHLDSQCLEGATRKLKGRSKWKRVGLLATISNPRRLERGWMRSETVPMAGLWSSNPGNVSVVCQVLVTNFGRLALGCIEADVGNENSNCIFQ